MTVFQCTDQMLPCNDMENASDIKTLLKMFTKKKKKQPLVDI